MNIQFDPLPHRYFCGFNKNFHIRILPHSTVFPCKHIFLWDLIGNWFFEYFMQLCRRFNSTKLTLSGKKIRDFQVLWHFTFYHFFNTYVERDFEFITFPLNFDKDITLNIFRYYKQNYLLKYPKDIWKKLLHIVCIYLLKCSSSFAYKIYIWTSIVMWASKYACVCLVNWIKTSIKLQLQF